MQHERQLEIIDALMDLVDRGETARTDRLRFNDLSVYTDPDLLAREREVFFRQWPLVAALSADLPRPGAYVAQTMLETPVLIARGRDGVARAFVNACRHRGARIVEPGCGARNLFSCPFHAWSYTPEGRLAAAPHADSFGDLDSAQFSLTPLPLVERYGIIWVRLQPRGDAFDVDDYLGGLGPELEGWRLADGPRVGETEIECGINWKFAIDTFGETYHFETLHRDSVNNIFHSNRQLYDIYGRNHRMVFVARTIDELRNRPRADWRVRPHSLFAYYLFPNTQLLIQRSGASLFRIFPDAERPDRSVTRHAFYTEPFATDADSLAAAYATFEGTQRIIATEDYVMAEQAQAGLASGALRQAVFGRNEPALHHYHNTYRAALGLPPLAEAM